MLTLEAILRILDTITHQHNGAIVPQNAAIYAGHNDPYTVKYDRMAVHSCQAPLLAAMLLLCVIDNSSSN